MLDIWFNKKHLQRKKKPYQYFAIFHFTKKLYQAFLNVVFSGLEACVYDTK